MPADPGLSVAILSPGAVGGFLAALLWRAGVPVTCVASPATARALEAEGLRLESGACGDFVAWPQVVEQVSQAPSILFIATKAPALAAALEQVPPEAMAGTLIVPLLNGLEHMVLLRARYGAHVLAGSIGQVEVMRRAAGHIVHTTRSAHITLASDDPAAQTQLARVAGVLTAAGVGAEVLASEAAVLWGKLVRLNAIAATTAASQLPVGQVRTDPAWRARLAGCADEGARVATAEGFAVDAEAVLRQIDALPAGLSTSLQRDVAAGHPSELEAIAGAVVRAGARHGLDCPHIASLIEQIRAYQPAPLSAA